MLLLYGKYIAQVADAVLDRIEARRKAGLFRRAFLIVPDARSLSLEQRYLERMEQGSLMRAEILSFGRLALRFAQEDARALPKLLPAQSQALLLRELLLRDKQDFPLLNPLSKKPAYLENLRMEMASLRRLGFPPEFLATLAEEAAKDTALAGTAEKLGELAKLASAYDEMLDSVKRRDSSADLDLLAEIIETWAANDALPTSLKNSEYYILGFGENRLFSKQEEQVIQGLERLGLPVCVSCIADYYPADSFALEQGAMAWRQGRRVLLALSEAYPGAEVVRVETQEPAAGKLSENLNFTAQPPQEALVEHKVNLHSPFIFSEHERELLEKVLGYIKQRVKQEGLRYKDFALCLCDAPLALRYLPGLLKDFDVPAFIDERESLAESRLFLEVSAFCHAALSHFDLAEVCLLLRLKCDGSEPALQAIDLFENFCLERGISGFKLFNEKYYRDKVKPEKAAETLAFARNALFPFYDLFNRFRKLSRMAEAVSFIKEYLEVSDCEVRTLRRYETAMAAHQAEEARSVSVAWNSLIALLEDSSDLLPETVLNASEFYELILRSSSSSYIGAVPSLLDEVYVGNPHTCLSQRPKQLILLNPTAENFPGRTSLKAILNSEDYRFLEIATERKLPLSEADAPYEDSFFVHQLLSSGDELPLIARNGEDGSLPRFLLEIMGLPDFGAYEKAKDQAKNADLYLRLYSRRVQEQLAATSAREGGTATESDASDFEISAEQLLFAEPVYSVTRLERYKACPYSYFMQYLLGITKRPELVSDDRSKGGLRHLLMEDLVKNMLIGEHNPSDPQEQLQRLQALKEAVRLPHLLERLRLYIQDDRVAELYLEPGHFGRMTRPIFQASTLAAELLQERFNKAGRWPFQAEWEFGLENKPPLLLSRPESNEPGVKMRGLIDLLDLRYSDEGRKIISLTDYKSSKREVDYFALWEGLDLQLPVYLMATQQLFNLSDEELGAASYLHLARPADESDKVLSESLKGLESSLDLDLRERRLVLDKSRAEILRATAEIRRGRFPLQPRAAKEKSACRFCQVRSLCDFDNPEMENENLTDSSKKAFKRFLEEI